MQSAPDIDERKTRPTVFERYAKSIRIALVLLPILAMDCGASLLIVRDSDGGAAQTPTAPEA